LTGVGTREVAIGVAFLDERGLFFDLGLDGACRKSSGMSFQLSMACGTGAVVEGTLEGAEADLGGGGGRFDVGDGLGGGCEAWSACLVAAGFFSQLDIEDCSMVVGAYMIALCGLLRYRETLK
jgi:hypothetical protein